MGDRTTTRVPAQGQQIGEVSKACDVIGVNDVDTYCEMEYIKYPILNEVGMGLNPLILDIPENSNLLQWLGVQS